MWWGFCLHETLLYARCRLKHCCTVTADGKHQIILLFMWKGLRIIAFRLISDGASRKSSAGSCVHAFCSHEDFPSNFKQKAEAQPNGASKRHHLISAGLGSATRDRRWEPGGPCGAPQLQESDYSNRHSWWTRAGPGQGPNVSYLIVWAESEFQRALPIETAL